MIFRRKSCAKFIGYSASECSVHDFGSSHSIEDTYEWCYEADSLFGDVELDGG